MPKSKTFKATDEDFETYDESRVRGENLLFEKQFITFIYKDCVEDREMQSFTFSFVYITSSKLFTVFYISMKLSPMKITVQPLRRFSRHFQSKTELFRSMHPVYKQRHPDFLHLTE